MTQALIFSIEEFSVFDGPGMRTTVFLKGCPLHCEWCHNPEGLSFQNSVIRTENGCTHCGACIEEGYKVCGKRKLTAESIKVCPNGLVRMCAESYTPQRLVEKLNKNRKILNAKGGGVTFSGGEVMAQPEFLKECLIMLRGKTNRALQTSGYCEPGIWEDILMETDYVLYDIKLMDSDLHRRYTGVDNGWILQNFHTLCESGVPFVVRTPLIPGVTDTTENLSAIAQELMEHEVKHIDLMTYNKMAGAKYGLVGKRYEPFFDVSKEVEYHPEIWKAHGIRSYIL